MRKVKEFAARHNLNNIRCLPYQPFNELAASLSSADLHTVVMGNEFVGIVHPSKIYNILNVGSPFLYIGPEGSHISEIAGLLAADGNCRAFIASNGAPETVANYVLEAANRKSENEERHAPQIAKAFSREVLLPQLIKLLESQGLNEDSKLARERDNARPMSAIR